MIIEIIRQEYFKPMISSQFMIKVNKKYIIYNLLYIILYIKYYVKHNNIITFHIDILIAY